MRCAATAFAASLFAACVLPATLSAQWTRVPRAEGTGIDLQRLEVSGSRLGGYGFLAFAATNTDSVPHRLRLGYEVQRWSGADAASAVDVVLAPGEAGRWYLPLPGMHGVTVQQCIEIDGSAQYDYLSLGERERVALVADGAMPGVGDLLAAGVERTGVGIRPRDLPPDWSLLTAFATILVDGRAGLDANAQELLRSFAGAGGAVVVHDAAALRAGPLRELLDAADGPVAVGLGVVAAVADWQPSRSLLGLLAGRGREELRTHMLAPQAIPGIGDVPVRGFLIVILLFAVLVGPVNFFIVFRRRQPLLALVTVPTLGFGTMALILAFGIFHDGFGIQGVVRSVSVLDQVRHEAATMATHSLFAGLSPARIEVPAGAVVTNAQALGGAELHRLVVAADGRSLEGAALPSRTATALTAMRFAPERARLRFAAHDDTLAPLPDGGFRIAGAGPFVLRTQEGRWYVWRGERLVACDEQRGQAAVRALADVFREVATGAGGGAEAADLQLGDLLHAREGELPPGSYLGPCEGVPWLGDLGLEVAYHRQQHLVYGRLGPEDIVR